jgi:uncharacterized protein (DUF58 family)
MHELALGLFLVTTTLLAWLGKATPSRWLLGILVLLTLAVGLAFLWPETVWVLAGVDGLLTVALLADRLLLSVAPKDIRVLGRETPERRPAVGTVSQFGLKIANSSRQAVTIHVRDGIPLDFNPPLDEQIVHVSGQSEGLLRYEWTPNRRGRLVWQPVQLRYRSRLGLLWISKTIEGVGASLSIYPNLKQFNSLAIRRSPSMLPGEVRNKVAVMQGTDFNGLRNYTTGDDIRRMDWKATARLDSPVVRTFIPAVEQPILLLLDTGFRMGAQVSGRTKLDWSLDAMLGFARVALDRGDQVAVGTFERSLDAQVNFGHGDLQFRRILDRLHDVFPTQQPTDFEWVFRRVSQRLTRRTLLVLFTDLIDDAMAQTLRRSVQPLLERHRLIVISYQDSGLEAMGHATPQTIEQAYEGGVALDWMHQRRRTLDLLAAQPGVLLVDCKPEQMSNQALRAYWTMRAQAGF